MNRINTKEFYDELIQFPEFTDLLYKYEVLMRDFIKGLANLSNNDVINASDGILKMSKQLKDMLSKASISKIFTNAGIVKNTGEIKLLFEAIIINYILLDLRPFKKLVIDVDKTTEIDDLIELMMEVDSINLSLVKPDIINMKYGQYS